MSYNEEEKVLYLSKVTRPIEHDGDWRLRILGTVADHHAIKVNTENGNQFLIERVLDKDPNDPDATVISNYENKNGEWKLEEFHHCKEGVTVEQVKKDAFDDKAYHLLTANCQQATRESIDLNSAYSAENDPNPLVYEDK